MLFATPTPTVQAYVIGTKLGYKPKQVFTNSVSATDNILTLAEKSGSDIVEGTISINYLLDPSNPAYGKQPGMKLYRSIMAKYAPKANASDIYNLYGVAKAWNITQVLQKAGPNLTRAGLMAVVRKMVFTAGKKNADPFLLPGVSIFTKGSFQYPISQLLVVKYVNHDFQPQGKLISGRGALR
jgi:branched-chain amino acid transport system substrate-binding protein